jgi:hypothetical protein
MFKFLQNLCVSKLTPIETQWFLPGSHFVTRRKHHLVGRLRVERNLYDEKFRRIMTIDMSNGKIWDIDKYNYKDDGTHTLERFCYKYDDNKKRRLNCHFVVFYDDTGRPLTRRLFNDDGSYTDTNLVVSGPRVEEETNRYGDNNEFVDHTITTYDEFGRYLYSKTTTTQRGRTWYTTNEYVYEDTGNNAIKEIHYNTFHHCLMITTREYDTQGNQIACHTSTQFPTFETKSSFTKKYAKNDGFEYVTHSTDSTLKSNDVEYFTRPTVNRGYLYRIPKILHWLFRSV